jgi:pimeloyl-ACP methyl ester carboxylesterase
MTGNSIRESNAPHGPWQQGGAVHDWRGGSRDGNLRPSSSIASLIVPTIALVTRPSSHRPDAVIVHGALGSAAQMQPVADALTASGRFGTVAVLELPGHGRTPLDDDAGFSMPGFADALAAGITARGMEQPLIFGYSMGGYVALLLESRAPGTLGGIVTFGTKLHWTNEVAAAASARLDAAVLRAKAPAFADILAARHAEAGGWERMLARTGALLRALGASPWLDTPALTAVHCPVHLLVGADDDTVHFEEAATAASHIPHARASLLENVSHPIERVPLALIVREMTDLAASLEVTP